MPELYLVRHGKAATAWGSGGDPALAPEGLRQARDAAKRLAGLGPLPILSSPMARARETARPLSEAWGTVPVVEPRVSEIPTPPDRARDRAAWIYDLLGDSWDHQPPALHSWRERVLEALLEIQQDTVIFTHFVAINAAVGAATGDSRVTCFWPDNGSVTVLETKGETLGVKTLGRETQTRIG